MSLASVQGDDQRSVRGGSPDIDGQESRFAFGSRGLDLAGYRSKLSQPESDGEGMELKNSVAVITGARRGLGKFMAWEGCNFAVASGDARLGSV